MKYAIIVWATKDEVNPGPGVVYGWYESLATAVKTATNLVQFGTFFQATAVKVV
jgi:hypothetical protein